MDKDRLKHLIYPTSLLLTFLGDLDIDDLFYACRQTNLSVERVLETKCGSTLVSVQYLLSFLNPIKEESCVFRSNKAYTVEMQGVSTNGLLTKTGHCFVLINDGVNWLMIDSYIKVIILSYKIINIEHINNVISELNNGFIDDLWLDLTGCNNDDEATIKMHVLIFEYDYSFINIDRRFLDIVKRAKKRLNEEYIGTDDSYLSLLSYNLDINDANNYLDSLCPSHHTNHTSLII